METSPIVSDGVLAALQTDLNEKLFDCDSLVLKQVELACRARILAEMRDFVGANNAFQDAMAMGMAVDVARLAAMAALQRLEAALRPTHG